MESSIWGLPCAPFSFCTISHPRMIGSDPCPVSPTPSAANRRGNWQELIEPRQLFASQIKRWHIGPTPSGYWKTILAESIIPFKLDVASLTAVGS